MSTLATCLSEIALTSSSLLSASAAFWTAQAPQPGTSGLLQRETLVYFYALVAPGLVAFMVYDLLVPTQRRDFGANFVQALTFGGINFALWAWVALINLRSLAEDHPLRFYLLAVAMLLLSPAVLAYILVRLRNAEFMKGIISSTAPTGWDAFFGRGESCLVLFHLKNGEKIGGLFADRSDASTFPNVQQVYVEEFWKLDEDFNLLEKIPRSNGGIIDKMDCDYVEFFTLNNQASDDPTNGTSNGSPDDDQGRAIEDEGDRR